MIHMFTKIFGSRSICLQKYSHHDSWPTVSEGLHCMVHVVPTSDLHQTLWGGLHWSLDAAPNAHRQQKLWSQAVYPKRSPRHVWGLVLTVIYSIMFPTLEVAHVCTCDIGKVIKEGACSHLSWCIYRPCRVYVPGLFGNNIFFLHSKANLSVVFIWLSLVFF
jgi:hypothetical protein